MVVYMATKILNKWEVSFFIIVIIVTVIRLVILNIELFFELFINLFKKKTNVVIK